MPKRVEEVRFKMDRFLLGERLEFDLGSRWLGSVCSGDGVAGAEDSADVVLSSKARRGFGRRRGI